MPKVQTHEIHETNVPSQRTEFLNLNNPGARASKRTLPFFKNLGRQLLAGLAWHG